MDHAGCVLYSIIRNEHIKFEHRYKIYTGREHLIKPEKEMIACYFLEIIVTMLHFQCVNLTVWEKIPWNVLLMYIHQRNGIILI